MTNPAYHPERSTPSGSLDYDQVPSTGVHAVYDPIRDRDRNVVRWGGLLAGMAAGLGTQIILGLLGVAIGFSTTPMGAGMAGLTTGTAIWFGVQSIIAFFIAGWVASQTSRPLSRLSGLNTGFLTWAVTTVVSLWLLGSTAAAAGGSVLSALQSPGPTPGMPFGRAEAPTAAAWYAFFLVLATLIACAVAGVLAARRQSQMLRAYGFAPGYQSARTERTGEPEHRHYDEARERARDLEREREREHAEARYRR